MPCDVIGNAWEARLGWVTKEGLSEEGKRPARGRAVRSQQCEEGARALWAEGAVSGRGQWVGLVNSASGAGQRMGVVSE